MALMYRLSCSFTEQFMGMPVTCDNTLGEGLASLEPQGHLPTPLSLVRSRGRVFWLICLCPGVPSTRATPQKVNLCFPNGFFGPRPRGGSLKRADLSLDGKLPTLPVCPPERTLPEQNEVFRSPPLPPPSKLHRTVCTLCTWRRWLPDSLPMLLDCLQTSIFFPGVYFYLIFWRIFKFPI